MTKKILYISGSLGLGHILRDVAVAKELRKLKPDLEISWVAANPASQVLRDAGENLLPESDLYANENIPAEKAADGFRLNIVKYLLNARKEWAHNVEIFRQVISKYQFDLIIGDETYEIGAAMVSKQIAIEIPFVMIYDFLGLDSMTNSLMEKIMVYIWNFAWAQDYKIIANEKNLGIFIGELEDVQDKKFGPLLPNRREHAKNHYEFVGYILPFEPKEYADTEKVRKKLGYGQETLVVCSIGGTWIGKEVLELCGKSYSIIKQKFPDLRMILVCGPRLLPESLEIPDGVEVRRYVPDLYQHFAACDLAIVQGGGTTTLELTALRRPFIYFPLEGHCEQEIVASRLARHGAGIRMWHSLSTPESLAEKVISNIGKEVSYPPIPTDGAQKAAQLISQLL